MYFIFTQLKCNNGSEYKAAAKDGTGNTVPHNHRQNSKETWKFN